MEIYSLLFKDSTIFTFLIFLENARLTRTDNPKVMRKLTTKFHK